MVLCLGIICYQQKIQTNIKVYFKRTEQRGQIGKPIPARIIGRPVVMGPGLGALKAYIIGAMETEKKLRQLQKCGEVEILPE